MNLLIKLVNFNNFVLFILNIYLWQNLATLFTSLLLFVAEKMLFFLFQT